MHLPAQLGIQRHANVLRGLGMSYDFAIHNYRHMMIPSVVEGVLIVLFDSEVATREIGV